MFDPLTAFLFGTMLQRRSMFDAGAHAGQAPLVLADAAMDFPVRSAPPRAGAAQSALGRILSGSVFPLRYEPDNPVSIHRGVASSSGAFPLDLLVTDPVSGKAWLADPANFVLTPSAASAIFAPAAKAGLQLTLIGRLDRLVARYGDLAFALAAYEAGMVAGQLRLLALLEGWNFAYAPVQGELPLSAGSASCAWYCVPLVTGCLQGSTAHDIGDLATSETRQDLPCTDLRLEERAPLTLALLGLRAGSQPLPPELTGQSADLPTIDIGRAIRNRTSDGRRCHTHPLGEPMPMDCQELLAAAEQVLRAMGGADLVPGGASLLLICGRGTRTEAEIVQLGTPWQRQPLDPPRHSALRSLTDDDPHQDAACYILIDELFCPVTDYGSLVAELVRVGTITQALCLGAAHAGWYARPVRNFDDVRTNAVVAPHLRVAMKVEVGPLAALPFGFALEPS